MANRKYIFFIIISVVFYNLISIFGLSIPWSDDLTVYLELSNSDYTTNRLLAGGRGLSNLLMVPFYQIMIISPGLARLTLLIFFMLPISIL